MNIRRYIMTFALPIFVALLIVIAISGCSASNGNDGLMDVTAQDTIGTTDDAEAARIAQLEAENARLTAQIITTSDESSTTGVLTNQNTANNPNPAGSFGNQAAMTTESVKTATGVDVQRLATEQSAWVWRAVPKAVTRATCPSGFVCTLHTVNGQNETIIVVVGDNTVYDIVAGTFRNVAGYPTSDDVWESPPCRLLVKEQQFGASEVPSFSVSAGNFRCDTAISVIPTPTWLPTLTGSTSGCPMFGNRQTTVVPNDTTACKLDWNGQTVTGTVPNGWYAQTDTSGVVQEGQQVTIGSATFRRNGG